MRKIILLLMLCWGFAGYSQECIVHIFEPEFDTSTCPEVPNLIVNFEVVDSPQTLDLVEFEIYNSEYQ